MITNPQMLPPHDNPGDDQDGNEMKTQLAAQMAI
jgi:hypothetical protein